MKRQEGRTDLCLRVSVFGGHTQGLTDDKPVFKLKMIVTIPLIKDVDLTTAEACDTSFCFYY